MRQRVLLAAALAVALVSQGGHAAPEPPAAPLGLARRALPIEGVITNPDWARKPTGNDIANYYPRIAQVVGIDGAATIHCSVTAEGGLAGCTVIAETPKGLRFGEATLRLANLFRMKPMTVDGAPVSGGAINIPVRFTLPPPQAPAAGPAAASTPAPSAKAMAFAHRIAVVTAEGFVIAAKMSVEQLRASLAPLSHEEEVALDGFDQTLAADTGEMADGLAAAYAKTYSEAELASLATFFESPAGRAWITRSRELTPAVQAVSLKFYQSVVDGSRARLCQQITCLAPRTPTPTSTPAPAAATPPPAK